MAVYECSPKHFVLAESHPLSKELYANVFGEVLPSSQQNFAKLFDVCSVTENQTLFRNVINFLAERYRGMGDAGPTHILGLESRGFLIGAPLAFALGVPFVPVRVTKRFPSSFVQETPGVGRLPLSHVIRNSSITQASRVVVVDDFIATGNTATSALRLTDIVGAKLVEVVAVCDVPSIHGVRAIHTADGGHFKNTPVLTLMHFKANRETILDQLQVLNPRIARSRL